MGFVSKESGVLKLVYPGGIVEIHTEPIAAAQVMKRNPRHCVTRPDIFRFPWLVVRPESVLKPGNVFFIVPYHTIYRLLQSKESQHQHYLCPRQKVTSPTSNCRKTLGPSEDRPTGCFPSKIHDTNDEQVHGLLNSSGQIGELRSCLKKEKTRIAKSRGFRVRFALDHEDDTKKF